MFMKNKINPRTQSDIYKKQLIYKETKNCGIGRWSQEKSFACRTAGVVLKIKHLNHGRYPANQTWMQY